MTGLSTKSCANVNWQNDKVAPAFCIDPDDRISRYLLFKVANYAVGAYEKWKRYVLKETDLSRSKLLKKGLRHDITEEG